LVKVALSWPVQTVPLVSLLHACRTAKMRGARDAMNGEDLPSVIENYAAKTGHVQIADNPGRGAPGTGSLPLEELLDRLGKAGYDGWIGLEYKPGDRPSAEAFDWLPRDARPAR
jgi:hydroxypyruvate isomerase